MIDGVFEYLLAHPKYIHATAQNPRFTPADLRVGAGGCLDLVVASSWMFNAGSANLLARHPLIDVDNLGCHVGKPVLLGRYYCLISEL